MPHARRWGAIASRGVRNLPKGRQPVVYGPPAPAPSAPPRRTHICSAGCECRARHAEPWTREERVPVVLHRDAGVTYASGGGTRTVPTKAGKVAFGKVLTIVTPGRPATGRSTFLDADRAARARTNTQTSDPIVMPDNAKVRELKTGLTYHARRQDAEGQYVGELKEREPKSPFIVALSSRTGAVRVGSVNKSGIGWGRTWGRKGKARPYSGGGDPRVSTRTRKV